MGYLTWRMAFYNFITCFPKKQLRHVTVNPLATFCQWWQSEKRDNIFLGATSSEFVEMEHCLIGIC
jgi:hypothetical protein